MSKPSVRCKCGHCVLRNEVLRTELWERGRGRDTVCVRYRCRRCKRLGEAFIPEGEWDWSLLEAPRGEFSAEERDRFADWSPISQSDLLDFHRALENAALPDWQEAHDTLTSGPLAGESLIGESRAEDAPPGSTARNERSRRERSERRDETGHKEPEHGLPDLPPEHRSKP